MVSRISVPRTPLVATDATARFARMDGRDVFFLTGMDEHGEKVAEAAAAHGMTPQEWCDAKVTQFTELWRDLDITNDDFIRTTQPRHVKGVPGLHAEAP